MGYQDGIHTASSMSAYVVQDICEWSYRKHKGLYWEEEEAILNWIKAQDGGVDEIEG